MCMTWISQKYPSDLKIGEMWLEEGLDVRICTLSAVVKVIIRQKNPNIRLRKHKDRQLPHTGKIYQWHKNFNSNFN